MHIDLDIGCTNINKIDKVIQLNDKNYNDAMFPITIDSAKQLSHMIREISLNYS